MHQLFRKLLGREAKADIPKKIKYDDVTNWMAGEANQETLAEIARQLGDPNSPVSRHLVSQADPHGIFRDKGEEIPGSGRSR